jgi:outer membrane protein
MKQIITFLLLLVFVKAYSQDTPTRLNLNQCIEIAIKNNLTVQKSTIEAESARISWQQARYNMLPTINASINHGLNQGRSIDPLTNTYVTREATYASPSLSSSLLLFNGLAMQNLLKQNALAYKATRQEEQQAKDNLTLNVILAYLQVLSNQDLFVLAKTQQETTIKQVERLEILNQNGSVSPGIYYDLKGQYANDQLSVINIGNALETSKINLVELLNVQYSKDLQLEPLSADQFSLIYSVTPEQVYESAIQNLASVKAVDFRKASADMSVKAYRSRYYPSVYFNAGTASNFSNAASDSYFTQFNNNQSKSFSVGISIPILNGFRTRNNISFARLNQRESELVAQTTRTQLQQLTQQAYFNMTASKDRFVSLEEQVSAYKESFRTVEIRFNEGALNSVDYLVAKNNLDRANANMLTNRYDFILRKKILDFYQGKPLGL